MRIGIFLAALALLLPACDTGDVAEAVPQARRDVTYLAYATGSRFRYRLTASGVEPFALVRDTAGSVAYTYAVPCGVPVSLSVDALGTVPGGASLIL